MVGRVVLLVLQFSPVGCVQMSKYDTADLVHEFVALVKRRYGPLFMNTWLNLKKNALKVASTQFERPQGEE